MVGGRPRGEHDSYELRRFPWGRTHHPRTPPSSETELALSPAAVADASAPGTSGDRTRPPTTTSDGTARAPSGYPTPLGSSGSDGSAQEASSGPTRQRSCGVGASPTATASKARPPEPWPRRVLRG